MAVRRQLPESLVRAVRSGRNATRGRLGIRARLLSIVLITSVTLVIVGVGAAGYLVKSSLTATVWANLISSTTTPVISMVQSFEEERRLSLLYLAGDPSAANSLVDARKHSDIALAAVIAKGEAAQRLNPGGSAAELETFRPLYSRVPGVRTAIDARAMPQEEAFGFFNTVIGTIPKASLVAARVAPGAGLGIALGYGVEPLRAAEALSQADTLGTVALARGEITAGQLLEFTRYTGEVRAQVAYSATVLTGSRLAQLRAITDSPDWQQVIAMQDALVLRGPVPAGEPAADPSGTGEDYDETDVPETAPLPMTVPAWQEASGRLNSALLALWESQSRDAHAIARTEGTDTAGLSLIGGVAVLIVTAVAFSPRSSGPTGSSPGCAGCATTPWNSRTNVCPTSCAGWTTAPISIRRPKWPSWTSAPTNSARWPRRSTGHRSPPCRRPWPKPRPGPVSGRSSSISPIATSWPCTASWHCWTEPNVGKRTPTSSSCCSNSTTWPPEPGATPRTSSSSAANNRAGGGVNRCACGT